MGMMNCDWSTAEEINYLHGLGNWWIPSEVGEKGSRLTLLKNYKASIRFRHEWGTVDKGFVEDVVDRFIASEEMGRPEKQSNSKGENR